MTTQTPLLHHFTVHICHQVHETITVEAQDHEEALEIAFDRLDAECGPSGFTLVCATAEPVD